MMLKLLPPVACLVVLAMSLPGLAADRVAPKTVRRYAIIVANNAADEDGVPPLSYADDDGARYYELFRAAGTSATLLAVLDPAAQRRHPDALAVAMPPTRSQLASALQATFDQISADGKAGYETHLYFVYTGHGNVGPNREGYLNLLGSRFGRSDLYREVLARSPATFNHVILDACHAYFVVQKRGGGSDKQGDFQAAVREFLRTEELAAYPNTGVIFAASSESETQEWSRWESGIFSHELRSALLGGADVDGDGRITYQEAAAFVEAANAAIDVPRARLRVFSRPPAMRNSLALMETAAFTRVPSLVVDAQHAGRYHVEDVRGVRIADLNSSSEQPVRLALVGKAPFYLRTANREAVIPAGDNIEVRTLRLEAAGGASRGSVETSFRAHLFEIAFGRGFYHGVLVSLGEEQLDLPSPGLAGAAGPAKREPGHLRPWALACLAAALATGTASAVTYYYSHTAHEAYAKATTAEDARKWHETTDSRLLGARLLLGAAGVAAATGVVLLILDPASRGSRTGLSPAVSVAGGVVPGVTVARTW